VKLRFEQAKLSLEASEHFAQLKSTLTSVAVPAGINRIFAFGCSYDLGGGRSLSAQHGLAHLGLSRLTIRDLLANVYTMGSSF
jgi:hypothetical protein